MSFVMKSHRRTVRRAVRLACQVVSEDAFRLVGRRALDLSPAGMLLESDADAQIGDEFIGYCQHDVFITREEIRGLMSGLLDVEGPASGSIRLSEWCRANATHLGRHYASELARRRDRTTALVKELHRRGNKEEGHSCPA